MAAEDATPSLLEELAADQGISSGHACGARTILDAMSDEDRQQWEAALRNPAFTAASLFRAGQRHNLGFTEQSIQRHARRMRTGQGCQCPR